MAEHKLRAICPHCDRKPLARPQHFGKTVTCPACSRPFEVCRLEIPSPVLGLFPEGVAHEYKALPLDADDETVTVAVADPSALDALDALAFVLRRRVKCVAAPESAIAAELARHFAPPPDVDAMLQEFETEAREFSEALGPKGPVIICRCEACGTQYALGVNAAVSTFEDVVRLLNGGGGMNVGRLPKRPAGDADLVGLAFGAESWPEGVFPPRPTLPVPHEVLAAREDERFRPWQCNQCKTIQPYPWCGGSTDDVVQALRDGELPREAARLARAKAPAAPGSQVALAEALDRAAVMRERLPSAEAAAALSAEFGRAAVELFDGAIRLRRVFDRDARTERVAARQPAMDEYFAGLGGPACPVPAYVRGVLETVRRNRDSTAVCECFLRYLASLYARSGFGLAAAGADSLLGHMHFLHYLADRHGLAARCKTADHLADLLDQHVEDVRLLMPGAGK